MLKAMSYLALAVVLSAGPARAAADKMQRSLEELEPGTRMVEVGDIAVSSRLTAETPYSRVDRIVAAAVIDSVESGDTVTAPGAAFRDHGHWYGLRYSCMLTPDHLATKSVRYAVGHEIPESHWEQYGLWR